MPTSRRLPRAVTTVLLLCLVAGAVLPAPALAADPPDVRELVTSAGTRLLQRQPTTPGSATIVAIMQVGTASQRSDETHAAHIAEHMVFQNQLTGEPSLTDQIAAWGGEANGHVGLEHTSLQITVPEQHLPEAVNKLLASLFVTTYQPEIYERELNGYMRVELHNMTANYPTALYNGFRQHIFRDSAYAEDLFGVDITQVPREASSGWQQREYGANRLILVVNSNTPWAELCSLVESALEGAPQAAVPPAGSVELAPLEEGTFSSPGVGNVTMMLGLSIDRVAANDRGDLSILLELLQRRMLFGAIRELKPLASLFTASWQSDSVYLQLAYEPREALNQGRDPILTQQAEFAKAVQLLTQLGRGDLRLLHQRTSTQASSPPPSTAPAVNSSLEEAWQLAGNYLPEFWSEGPSLTDQVDEQALLTRLQEVAAKYLPRAKLTMLRTAPAAQSLWPLATILVGLTAIVLLAALAVRRWAERKVEVRIFLSLIAVMLKSLLRRGTVGLKQDEADNRALWRWIFAAVFLAVAVWLTSMVAQICMLLGQPELLLVLASAALCLMLFFSGGSLMLSVFLWSGDSERLAVMPLDSAQVVISRLLIVVLGQYPLSFLVLISATWKYAQYMGKGPLIWVTMGLVALLLPILALTLAALPIVALVRYITPRLRERLMAVASILLSGAWMLYRLTQGSGRPQELSSLLMQSLQLRQQDLSLQIGRVFPPAIWAGRTLFLSGTWAGIGNLLLLVLTAGLCLWLLIRLSLRCHLGELSQAAPARKQKSARRQNSAASPLLALWRREWRLFWRTPALLAVTLPNTLMPLLAIYPLLSSGIREQGIWVMAQALRGTSSHSLIPALTAGALAMLVVTSSRLASISISGEGSRFYFSKMIPVDGRTQVQAKLLNCLAVDGLCMLPGLLLVAIWLRLSLLVCIAAVLAAAVGILFAVAICIKHDLTSPRLDWDNTQTLIREANAIGPTMIILFTLALSIWLVFSLQRGGWAMPLIFGLVLAAYAAIAWGSYRSLLGQADDLYAETEL